MEVEPLTSGQFKVSTSDREFEQINKLGVIYGMEYENVIEYMFAFALHMAKTRILDKI